MSLILKDIKGKPSIVLLKHLGSVKTKPTTIALTTSALEEKGSTVIGIDAEAVTIPKNAILQTPIELLVNRAEADLTAGGDLTVSLYGGSSTDGLSAELASGATINWDALFPDVGMDAHPFARNASVNTIQGSEYHGVGDDVSTDEVEVSSIAPTLSRSGLIDWGSQLHKDLEQYADTNAYWWCKQMFISDEGTLLAHREDHGKVTGWSEGVNVSGKLSCSYTFRFYGKANLVYPS